jgi:hypothetical protein
MTKVEALVADDGIVVASDGNAYDSNQEVIADNHIKQFELSPWCAVMAAGNINLGFPDMMAAMHEQVVESGNWHASLVAKFLRDQCNEASEMEGGEWLKDDSVMFNLAGYDYLEDGTFQPVLLALFRREGEWVLNEPVNERLMIGGAELDKWHQLLERKMQDVTPDLKNYNQLAATAIVNAERTDPKVVGGKITLWNIVPSTENSIIKFTEDEIKSLLSSD